MKISAVIPAAGSGARMGLDIKKPYLKIGSPPYPPMQKTTHAFGLAQKALPLNAVKGT
ncbi:TPA: hypothetical protein EYP66_04585, partial [Candidatus Poribacteria bacterium]|nr:hypothetical protein [Candidatus Poribacteria bacterium]